MAGKTSWFIFGALNWGKKTLFKKILILILSAEEGEGVELHLRLD